MGRLFSSPLNTLSRKMIEGFSDLVDVVTPKLTFTATFDEIINSIKFLYLGH